MSETKHTPGPWWVSWDKYGKDSEIHGKSELNDGPICIILHDDVTESGAEEQLANARLIAAAPELLEAAEGIVSRWDSPLWKDQPHTGIFIDRLRAAVAKAKGEQP